MESDNGIVASWLIENGPSIWDARINSNLEALYLHNQEGYGRHFSVF